MVSKHDDIRIGTLVRACDGAGYIKEILPYGFESFSITFGSKIGGIDIESFSEEISEALRGTDIPISSLGIYGNPLEDDEEAGQTREGWEVLIEKAHLFKTDIIAGFTGRVRGRPLPDSMGKFSNVFGELNKEAKKKNLKLAFENCPMGGTWETGDMNIAINPRAWELMFETVPDENIGLQWEP